MTEGKNIPAASAMGLWPFITGVGGLAGPSDMDEESGQRLCAQAERFAHLVGPVMAAHLLGSWRPEFTIPDFSDDEMKEHRLATRFRHYTAFKWVRFIAAQKMNPVYMKGFATAHDLYPEAELRTINDVDVLINREDLPRLAAALGEEGFHFSRSGNVPVWGFISDASFLPLMNPADHANIDLHLQPDDYPVHLSLDIGEVEAKAREIEKDGITFRIPCRDHLFLLAVTNAARDKFDQECLKSLCDALLILRHHANEIDWRYIEHLARKGGYVKPLSAFLALAVRLGIPASHLPRHLMPAYSGPAAKVFEKIIDDFAGMFPARPGRFTEILREFFLTAEPRSILWKYAQRLKGLVRPSSGLPPKGPKGPKG